MAEEAVEEDEDMEEEVVEEPGQMMDIGSGQQVEDGPRSGNLMKE